MLATIDRLRSERDDIRRGLEFLEAESKFAEKDLRSQLEKSQTQLNGLRSAATAASIPLPPSPGSSSLDNGSGRQVANQSTHLSRVAIGSAILVRHLDSERSQDLEELERLSTQFSCVQSQYDELVVVSEGYQEALLHKEQSIRGLEALVGQTRTELAVSEATQAQLQVRVRELSDASLRARGEQAHLQSSLEQGEAQIAEVERALRGVESERDSLSNQVLALNDELKCAQEELVQAGNRYADLQTRQFSSMTSDQRVNVFKDQIQEYKERVERRNEQIGIHQHDIKRLEANQRLQEERIGELTTELESANAEKQSMIEDCAEAREARDMAMRRVEDLEEDLENMEVKFHGLERQRIDETSSLVSVWASSVARARSWNASICHDLRNAHLQNQSIMDQLQLSMSQQSQIAAASEDASLRLINAQQDHRLAQNEARQAIMALAVVQSGLVHVRNSKAEKDNNLQGQLHMVRQELGARMVEIGHLQRRLEATMSQHDQYKSSSAVQTSRLVELENRISELGRQKSAFEGQCVHLQQEVNVYKVRVEELTEQTAERTRTLEGQLASVQDQYASQLESLQSRLEIVLEELDDSRTARTNSDALHVTEVEKLNKEKRSIIERLDACLAELDEARKASSQSEELRILQEKLEVAETELQNVRVAKEELQTAQTGLLEEARATEEAAEARISELQTSMKAIEESLEESRMLHAEEIANLQQSLEDRDSTLERLRDDLANERARHSESATASAQQHNALMDRHEEAQTKLHETIHTVQNQLRETETMLKAVQEERVTLEQENTDLASAKQRLSSKVYYVESQLSERFGRRSC